VFYGSPHSVWRLIQVSYSKSSSYVIFYVDTSYFITSQRGAIISAKSLCMPRVHWVGYLKNYFESDIQDFDQLLWTPRHKAFITAFGDGNPHA
jgi:hypothetical protein